ncbi:MAG: hypothetical protein QXT73_06800 [Candidatus Methanomethylicaceae archaeon]
MNLLAFKALKRNGEILQSPTRNGVWVKKHIPQVGGEFFYLEADKPPEAKNRHGIYAGTFWEASGYEGDIYLVAPLPSPETVVAIGSMGWRASAAIVVGGPYNLDDENDQVKAAEQIIAAARAGYETIPGVLVWACSVLKESSFLFDLIKIPDKRIKIGIAEACGDIGESAIPVLKKVRTVSVEIFPAIARACEKIGPASIPILRRYAKIRIKRDRPTERCLRVSAILSLGKIGHEAIPVLWEVSSMVNESNMFELMYIAKACGNIGKETIPLLQFISERYGENTIIRNTIEEAFEKIYLSCHGG